MMFGLFFLLQGNVAFEPVIAVGAITLAISVFLSSSMFGRTLKHKIIVLRLKEGLACNVPLDFGYAFSLL